MKLKEFRFCLFEDGSAFGCFWKNSNSGQTNDPLIIFLHETGGCYSLLDSCGKITRHLTKFSSPPFTKALKKLIIFRNAHFAGDPYICAEFYNPDEIIELPTRIRSIRWPLKGAYRTNKLVSLDGYCSVSLSMNKDYARVTYLTPVTCLLDDKRYIKIHRWIYIETQDRNCPFYEAIQAMLNERFEQDLAYTMQYIITDIPRCPPEANEPVWPDLKNIDELSVDPVNTVLYDVRCLVEWTPACTFRVLKNTSNIRAFLSVDGSMLEFADVKRNTFRHIVNGEERIYAEGCVPRVIRYGVKVEYEIKGVAEKCEKLLQSLVKSTCLGQAESKTLELKPDKISKVVKQKLVPRLGVFKAFSDRSVRVIFADRTVLHSNSNFQQCNIIFEYGDTIYVNTDKPVHAKKYVEMARSFYFSVFCVKESQSRNLQTKKLKDLISQIQYANKVQREQLGIYLSSVPRSAIALC